ncbi:hypothetical protein RRF57_009563 [Xylaria bambusicola]|uniref:Uncharacterized protein n=1 Tax=Xylaria bambusicola TaxID=326684 RepID=A0AAN7UTQ5_9PEZI
MPGVIPVLIVDLLLPHRWPDGFRVPLELVLIRERAPFVSDGDDPARVANLLLRDAHGIFRDPEQRRPTGHRRWTVRITFDLVGVLPVDVDIPSRH